MTEGAVVIEIASQLGTIIKQGWGAMWVMVPGGDASGPWDGGVENGPRAAAGLSAAGFKPAEDRWPRPACLAQRIPAATNMHPQTASWNHEVLGKTESRALLAQAGVVLHAPASEFVMAFSDSV